MEPGPPARGAAETVTLAGVDGFHDVRRLAGTLALQREELPQRPRSQVDAAPPPRARPRLGFTLVETALALLVITLGLLGIFGLARHGLKASGEAEQETRCAILADSFFGTLRAKNNELTAKKRSLDEWWFYWFRFASGSSEVVLHLPYSPDIAPNDPAIRIALGTHELDDYLTPPTAQTEIRWNPTYSLTLDLNGVDPTSASSIAEVYERGEIDVKLTIHPGVYQSGAETRTYWTTLTYTGGLP